MSRSTRQGRRRAATYDEIVAAARELLAAGHQPTLRGVATRMGASPAGLYRYVTSHGELLDLVAASIDAQATADCSAHVGAQVVPEPADRWVTGWAAFRKWALAHRPEFQLVLARPHSGGTAIREMSDAWLGRLLHDLWVERDVPLPPTGLLDETTLAGLCPRSTEVWPPALGWLHARICASLHGVIALEVSGYADPRLVASGELFRATLVDWLARLGQVDDLSRMVRLLEAELTGE